MFKRKRETKVNDEQQKIINANLKEQIEKAYRLVLLQNMQMQAEQYFRY